jgi:hypothetical protein
VPKVKSIFGSDYPKIKIEKDQHWIHPHGQIVIIDIERDVVAISQLHSTTGPEWHRSMITIDELTSYLKYRSPKLLVSPSKIWKDLCLK